MFRSVTVESIYRNELRTEHFSALSESSPDVSSVAALFRPDEFGLDAFQHAIIASESVLLKVLSSLLSECDCASQKRLPYLHLAAILGHERLADDVRKLCEALRPDKRASDDGWLGAVEELRLSSGFASLLVEFKGEEFSRHVLSKLDALLRATTLGEEALSAVDVAVICGNRNYVDMFLQKLTDGRSPQKIRKLSTAVSIQCRQAVALLADEVSEDELYRVLALRVKDLKVEEARLILGMKKIDPGKRRRRREANLFHLACSSRTRPDGLDKMVRLLLDSGFDVNDGHRPRTYPLYSMIYSFVCEREINPKKVPLQHMNSLRAMLKAGADPNFDEILAIEDEERERAEEEARGEGEGHSMTDDDGRDPSSSALDCYFHCLQFHEKWNVNVMEQLDQICLLLLESGANPSYDRTASGSPLHSLMQLSACHHAQGHLSADFFSMSRMLLYFGADPDLRPPVDPRCPLQFYFGRLFDLMGGKIAFDRWARSSAVSQVAGLLTFMDRDSAAMAYRAILVRTDEMVSQPEEGFSRESADHVRSTLESYVTDMYTLQDMCKLALWRALGRRMNRIQDLHMPARLRESVASFFALEI